jgi:Outer membrane protein and related peptidoglycan-associated (lipo)proteins
VSDHKNNPPPDDFSKTTPNINLPSFKDDDGPTDWDKTNYNFPKQPAADDWGKTVTNIKPIDTDRQDFGKTIYPGARKSSDADWTAAGRNDSSDADFGSAPDDFGAVNDKTTPYFKLPEAERAKYQNLPPTPTEQAAREQKEQKEKGGIPGWVWILGGLGVMFFFAIIILGIVLYFVTRPTNFTVIVKSAPVGSDVRVDNESWGLPEPDGSKRIVNLRAGARVVTIVHPTQNCEPRPVDGKAGEVKEVIARCEPAKVQPGENCNEIGIGQEDKAERCYYAALDALPENFTADQLVAALNILIINFDSAKFDIPSHRQAALNRGAVFIKKLAPNIVLEVGGHTDNRGSDADNQKLSTNRANAVKQYLTGQGVRDGALQIRGYGATQPRQGADNNTDQGRFLNRRIQYSVVQTK